MHDMLTLCIYLKNPNQITWSRFYSILSLCLWQSCYQVVHITIEGLEASGFPINDYLTRSIDGYQSDPQTFPNFQLISSDTNTVLACHSAHSLVGTYYDLDHGTQKVLETGTVIDDKGYYIQYIADEPKYSALLPTVQNMINSFEISKLWCYSTVGAS